MFVSGLFRAHYRRLSACRVGGGHLHYRIREIRGGFSLRDICLCVLEHQQPNHRNKCWQRTSLQTADTLKRLHSFMLWLSLDRKRGFRPTWPGFVTTNTAGEKSWSVFQMSKRSLGRWALAWQPPASPFPTSTSTHIHVMSTRCATYCTKCQYRTYEAYNLVCRNIKTPILGYPD